MRSWKDIEAYADENGFIPEEIYNENASNFKICPPQDPEIARIEAQVWEGYLSERQKKKKDSFKYEEMYRFEWYEGRKRRGFWGNIEDAIKAIKLGPSARITILSAGSGRDLLKVGLAAGVWESIAPKKLRGTHREISPDYFRLARPGARIMVTEFEEHNFLALCNTKDRLKEKGLLEKDMITVRRWNFREVAPLATGTQDLMVFALSGNYAKIDEQPLILKEIARCVRKGGYLIASTLTHEFDFNKARRPLNALKFAFANPLGWPILAEFAPWQIRWGKMAGMMNKKGYWKNVPAEQWAEFLRPANMDKVKIYPAPSKLAPVEVLVARKKVQP